MLFTAIASGRLEAIAILGSANSSAITSSTAFTLQVSPFPIFDARRSLLLPLRYLFGLSITKFFRWN